MQKTNKQNKWEESQAQISLSFPSPPLLLLLLLLSPPPPPTTNSLPLSLSLPPSLPIKADPHGPACLLELPAITCETGESDLSREYLLILHSPNLVTWQT